MCCILVSIEFCGSRNSRRSISLGKLIFWKVLGCILFKLIKYRSNICWTYDLNIDLKKEEEYKITYVFIRYTFFLSEYSIYKSKQIYLVAVKQKFQAMANEKYNYDSYKKSCNCNVSLMSESHTCSFSIRFIYCSHNLNT